MSITTPTLWIKLFTQNGEFIADAEIKGLDYPKILQCRERIFALEDAQTYGSVIEEGCRYREIIVVSATMCGCACKPGRCMAPKVMGFQTPCLDPDKAMRATFEEREYRISEVADWIREFIRMGEAAQACYWATEAAHIANSIEKETEELNARHS
jgi:hypothetical protein